MSSSKSFLDKMFPTLAIYFSGSNDLMFSKMELKGNPGPCPRETGAVGDTKPSEWYELNHLRVIAATSTQGSTREIQIL